MRAAIDLGSNSVLLTVLDGDRVVHDEARVVGLGRGVAAGGPFRADRMLATQQVLVAYREVVDHHGIAPSDVIALTTSAARRASNADAFFAEVAAQTGFLFRTISGVEEATRTFIGALSGLDVDGRVLVVDLGGGSTELAMGIDHPEVVHSLPLGTVRLTEAVLGDDVRAARPSDLLALRDRVRDALASVGLPGMPDEVVGVAGTVTTLMATELGLQAFDAQQLHGALLTDDVLAGFEAALLGCDGAERRALFPIAPERADTLLAGCVVLRAVLNLTGEAALRVSTRGLRFGALQELPTVDGRHGIL